MSLAPLTPGNFFKLPASPRLQGLLMAIAILVIAAAVTRQQWWTEIFTLIGAPLTLLACACASFLALAGLSDLLNSGGPSYSRTRGALGLGTIVLVLIYLTTRQYWTELNDLLGFIMVCTLLLTSFTVAVLTAVGYDYD